MLASYAVPLEGVIGREHPESPDSTRLPFQRDRDRLLHTQAFRRLQGKTQVFVTGQGDHYRTRLTHTLEVAQISRDIARTLKLNEDLVECIALAHDLGHPPFGHTGEEAIDKWMRKYNMTFEHNEQSYRIVTLLENHTNSYLGLNLNREVLDGLKKHKTVHDQKDKTFSGQTLEAQIVNIADEIAYSAHDSDDGMHEDLFTMDQITSVSLASEARELSKGRDTSLRGALIHILVTDLYEESLNRLKKEGIDSLEDVQSTKIQLIGFSKKMCSRLSELRTFLWDNMYQHPSILSKSIEGSNKISELLTKEYKNPSKKIIALQKEKGSTLEEAVKDYVSGMTERYAEETVNS